MLSQDGHHLAPLCSVLYPCLSSRQSPLHHKVPGYENNRQGVACNTAHTIQPQRDSRVSGNCKSSRRRALSDPFSAAHTPCSCLPTSKIEWDCLSCQGGQETKQSVSLIKRGSCPDIGQKEQEPGGISKTKLLTLNNFFLHNWVANLGTMNR